MVGWGREGISDQASRDGLENRFLPRKGQNAVCGFFWTVDSAGVRVAIHSHNTRKTPMYGARARIALKQTEDVLNPFES